MFIGIDNSGDFKDSYWVIAIVVSSRSMNEIIEEARKKINKRIIFHATKDSKSVRKAFVETLSLFSLKSYVIHVRATPSNNVKNFIREIIGEEKAFIYFDNPLFEGLSVRKKGWKEFLVHKKDSDMYSPIQVADYFSNYWWRLFKGEVEDETNMIVSMTEKLYFLNEGKVIEFNKESEKLVT
ncbi:DUF3800 domain-containing protein [Sulfolobus tengchongensis]|uniref:DUF3800 domain-containing protein n=1 Tax=Sulfolobus tengchongensis TaxID=207809 RepID=A0AAX4L2J5_9CREN